MSATLNTDSSYSRIVVTGLGILAPSGRNIEEFANLLRTGKTGIQQHARVFEDRTIWAGLIEQYDPSEIFSEDEQQHFDRTAQMGYIAAKQALDDAGVCSNQFGEVTALTLGTSHGGRSQFDQFVMSGSDPTNDDFPRKLLVTAAHYQQTAAVASKLGIQGPTATLSNACSSSGAAVAYAIELLRSKKCTFAVAGGADGFSRLTFSGFSALGAMANGPCAPFSEPVGLSLGDGAGFLVLETLESAKARGAKIYAEIWGYGLSWDAYHITAPEPSGEGMNRAISMAIEHAGIERKHVEYVNVHGTGTRSNDLAETVGLQRYFEGSPPPVSSTKSQTGHMLGASSAVGLISCILGMCDDWLPPNANFTVARSGCDLDVVANEPRQKRWSCFMAQSAAFAGANAVIVGGRVSVTRSEPQHLCCDPQDEIVISGIGTVSPLGCGFQEFSDAILKNQSGIAELTEFDAAPGGCRVAGMVRNFTPRKLLPSINLRRVDKIASYATIATSLALQNAGLWPVKQGERIGLVVGVCRGAALSYEKYLSSVNEGSWDNASAAYFPNLVMSSVGGQVSASLGLKGITSSLVGGTAAGLQALIHGWELFRRNPSQDAVVVLAADELAPFYFNLFDRMGKLVPAMESDSFEPYSVHSKGMVLAEGAVALVLQRASKVRSNTGRCLATLKGSGLTNDAGSLGTAKCASDQLGRAYQLALNDASMGHSQVQSVYGSGLGLRCHDARELQAVSSVFGDSLIPRTVNKLTGVAEASSSLFNLAAAISETRNQKAGDSKSILVSASGHEGSNAALIMEVAS